MFHRGDKKGVEVVNDGVFSNSQEGSLYLLIHNISGNDDARTSRELGR